jgi:hypothetical protein
MANWLEDEQPAYLGSKPSAWDKGAALGQTFGDFATRFVFHKQTIADKNLQLGMASALLQQKQQYQQLKMGKFKLEEATKETSNWEKDWQNPDFRDWITSTPEQQEAWEKSSRPVPKNFNSKQAFELWQKNQQQREVYGLKKQANQNALDKTAIALEKERNENEAEKERLGIAKEKLEWQKQTAAEKPEAAAASAEPIFKSKVVDGKTVNYAFSPKTGKYTVLTDQQSEMVKKSQRMLTSIDARIKSLTAEGTNLSPQEQNRLEKLQEDKAGINAELMELGKDEQTKPGAKPFTPSTVPPPAQRKVGQTITTDQGTFKWTGTGWEAVEE